MSGMAGAFAATMAMLAPRSATVGPYDLCSSIARSTGDIAHLLGQAHEPRLGVVEPT